MIEGNDQRVPGDSGHSENPLSLNSLLDPVFRPLTSSLAITSENIPLELQPIALSSVFSPSNLFASLPPENSSLSLSPTVYTHLSLNLILPPQPPNFGGSLEHF